MTSLELGGITLDVQRKDIKNVHLSVYPPTGRVRISAPLQMNLEAIRLFAISKRGWIKRQQEKLRAQERETPREYLNRETHYLWGRRYLLKVIEVGSAPSVQTKHGTLILSVRRDADTRSREAIVATWHRQLLRAAIPPLIEAWEAKLGVTVDGFFVQQMKTKWGSCNPLARTIRVNTELVKKPKECLEYIVVHELVHLRERTHGPRFVALIDRALPHWRDTRELLNRLPARHQHWDY